MCAVPRSVIDRAKEIVRDRTGVPGDHLLVSATHTHTAPPAAHLFQSPPDPKYTEWLTVRIADCLQMAFQRLQPARIGWAVGSGLCPFFVGITRKRPIPGQLRLGSRQIRGIFYL